MSAFFFGTQPRIYQNLALLFTFSIAWQSSAFPFLHSVGQTSKFAFSFSQAYVFHIHVSFFISNFDSQHSAFALFAMSFFSADSFEQKAYNALFTCQRIYIKTTKAWCTLINIRVTCAVSTCCQVEQFCYKISSKLAVYSLFFFALDFSFQKPCRLSRLLSPHSNLQVAGTRFCSFCFRFPRRTLKKQHPTFPRQT